MKRLATILSAVFLLTLVGAAPVTATQPDDHKVTVCHKPEGRSYIVINVDIASSGYVKGGHHRPGGNVWDKHADGGDIIPPYTYGDFDYLGQNWTTDGQAIWNNGCQSVTPPVIPPVIPPIEPPVIIHGPPGEPKGPDTTVYRGWGNIIGPCGDPRVKFVVVNNGKTKATFRFRYINGKYKNQKKVMVTYKTVRPGKRFTSKWAWALGKTVATIRLTNTGKLLDKQRIVNSKPWGSTRRCRK